MHDPTALLSLAPTPAAALSLADSFVLVSWWKALLVIPPFVGWAWLVSTVFDKHAARFYLGQEKWGVINVACGLVAVVAAFAIPVPEWWSFLIGYALMLLILGGNIAAFVLITNKQEDKVPPEHKLKLDLKKLSEGREKKEEKSAAKLVALGIVGPGGVTLRPPEKETPEFEIRATAEELYIRGLEMRASRMDISPTSKEGAYAVTYKVDGVRQPGDKLPSKRAYAIMDFWKAAADLDLKDRRRRQAALITVKRAEHPLECRVVTSGRQGGMELSVLYNPKAQVNFQPDQLGMTSNQLEAARDLAKSGGGVVILAAPAGQGRTSLVYAATRLHDAYTENVQTVEFDPQISLEGIRQNVFDPSNADAEFATTVRSILRRDPDVVAVAELPDTETAKTIAKVDADRTRVYASLKADAALTAVDAWLKAVGDPGLAASTIRGVIVQRLVRTLCENCKVPFTPSAELLKKLGLPDQVKQLFKKGGQVLIKNKPDICPVCQGIGYVGQTGIFEVYKLDEPARELVKERNLAGLRTELRKSGLPTMALAALRTAAEGRTSVEEVMRVTGQQPPKKPSSSGKKPPQSSPQPAKA